MIKTGDQVDRWIWVGLIVVLSLLTAGVAYMRNKYSNYNPLRTSEHPTTRIPGTDCSLRPPDGVLVDIYAAHDDPMSFRSMLTGIVLSSDQGVAATIIASVSEFERANLGDYFGLDESAMLPELRSKMDMVDGVTIVSHIATSRQVSPFIFAIDDNKDIGLLSIGHLTADASIDLLRSVTCE